MSGKGRGAQASYVAEGMMARSNHYFKTEFVKVVHADWVSGTIEAVVRDRSGWLWLCRHQNVCPDGHEANGNYLSVLMPVWGPAPDPIDPLPVGHKPPTLAFLRAASSKLLILQDKPARPAA